jgi:hypothetical protein
MRKNDLSDAMQARLDKYKKEAASYAPNKTVGGYISKGDYLDSIQDMEDREAAQWKEHLQKNPEFRR